MHRTRKTKTRAQRQEGFSLLETAVAMVVMMIGGLGIAAVFAYAVKNNTGSRDRVVAIAVAQQEIERLRSLPFLDPALNATPANVTPTTVTNGGRSYRVRTTIVDTTASLKTIQIQVTPTSSTDAWSVRTVQVTTERAAFTLGPYIGGP
ncbi:MAG: type IV pilus modification PilV family protein [Pyrinomonadaceae bacterium]